MEIYDIDYETYYDKEYSLKKMTTLEYVLDRRFEIIGCSVGNTAGERMFLEEHELAAFFKALGDDKVMLVSHNALFDMMITVIRMGYSPTLMADTLGMARAMLRYKFRSMALASLAAGLGIGFKGNFVHNVIGMRKADIIGDGLWPGYSAYSVQDGALCRGIFDHIMGLGFPVEELVTMDQVIRMGVTPNWDLNRDLLVQYRDDVVAEKSALIAAAGLSNRDDLMSNDKLAAVLMSLGVAPPQKTSPTTGKTMWAFAKTDTAFTDLEEHPDPKVQAVVSARLGVKSTIEETRAQRLVNIGDLTWPDGSQGHITFPLRYSGAHTHRLSGEMDINLQNLKRGGKLRDALVVREGYKYVGADSSQIEARGVATISGCDILIQKFANGEDVYASFASKAFQIPMLTKQSHPTERFIGKTAILGLGYSLGWLKFQLAIFVQSGLQLGSSVTLTDAQAQQIVNAYRTEYREIPAMWRVYESMIREMLNPHCNIRVGPIVFQYQKILLPNGLYLHYHNLRWDNDWQAWVFEYGGKKKKLYGGKIMENVIQALCRIITMNAARRVTALTGFRLALQVHDEIGFIIPDAYVAWFKQLLLREMCVPPIWLPNIPLAAEAGVGQIYGDAK